MEPNLTDNVRDRIIKFLYSANGGQFAQEIAIEIGSDRDEVFQILQNELIKQTVFTDGYQWWIDNSNSSDVDMQAMTPDAQEAEISPKICEIQYREYIKSQEWALKADKCKKAAGGKCEICDSDRKLEAHHFNYVRLLIEEPEDLFCLCKECHQTYHQKLNGFRRIFITERNVRLKHIKDVIDGRVTCFSDRIVVSRGRSKLGDPNY